MPVSLALTACFAVCAVWALLGVLRPGAERAAYSSHLVMAASMVPMIWGVPRGFAVAAAAATGAYAVVVLVRGRPGGVMAAYHAGMLAVMALMWATMAGGGMPAGHEGQGGMPAHGPAPLTGVDSLLLVSALASFVAAALWWETAAADRRQRRGPSCRRDGRLEGLASLGMALAATAMVVAH